MVFRDLELLFVLQMVVSYIYRSICALRTRFYTPELYTPELCMSVITMIY